MSNLRFLAVVSCSLGLAFVFGALFQADYISKQRETSLSPLPVRENTPLGETQAGVSFADSVAFELAASKAHEIDLPTPTPEKGSPMCAFVRNDTVFLQYFRGSPWQAGMFRFKYDE